MALCLDTRPEAGRLTAPMYQAILPYPHIDPVLLHLCNSGDTAGDRDRVVGYTAISFQEHAHG